MQIKGDMSMNEIKGCTGSSLPVFAAGEVKSCGLVQGTNNIFLLKVLVADGVMPVAGQFFMLRSKISGVQLGRPISVFHVERLPYNPLGSAETKTAGGTVLHFLIMQKGAGTKELCSLKEGDGITALGPLGNAFPHPAGGGKVCIAGGGIGVAPVSAFAETLVPKSYDFFAAFKSTPYGLEHIKADALTITTDDGSAGTKGMISAVLTEDTLRQGGYKAVYACGPEAMLLYIKQIAEAAGVVCYISMERRMACGVGVCLGCTVQKTDGTYARCCKDGPVFDSREVVIARALAQSNPIASRDCFTLPQGGKTAMTERRGELAPDLSVNFKGILFKNPIIASSGTFGFATEYKSVFDVNRLGGIASKGVTLEPRQGNSGIRLWETPAGLLNSIGLQNPGIPHFIEHELPGMLALDPVTIVNLSGSTLKSYIEGAKLLTRTDAPIIELNISCPNVAAGGAAWGMTCLGAEQAVKAVRSIIKQPLIVKLTPQSRELTDVALRCIQAGADAISLCNSFQGAAIDIERGIPVFDKVKAGFGGPAIRPIAMRLVWEVCEAIDTLPANKRVPVFAIGGVEKWQDAVEYIMAGASFVEVGTAKFTNPLCMTEIIDGLAAFMRRKGYASIEEMRGVARKSSD